MMQAVRHGAVLALLTATIACDDAPAGDRSTPKPVASPARGAEVALGRPAPPSTARNPAPTTTPLPLADPATSALFNAAYQRVEDDWMPILFLCDGVEGKAVQLITAPVANGTSQFWTYEKRGFGTSSRTVRLGDSDAGAGQVYRAIETPDGRALGSVHSINPGIRGDSIATTLPTLSSITAGASALRCRWLQEARVHLVTSRRSVVVTREGDNRYTYRSFDYARPDTVEESGSAVSSTPTTEIRGGRLAVTDNRETYVFERAPWRYEVSASAESRAPGASLKVLKSGKAVQVEIAAAYQMAAKRIE